MYDCVSEALPHGRRQVRSAELWTRRPVEGPGGIHHADSRGRTGTPVLHLSLIHCVRCVDAAHGLLQHRLRAPQIHHLRSNPPGRTPLALRWNSRRIRPTLAVRDRRDSRDLNDDSVITAFSVSCSTLRPQWTR